MRELIAELWQFAWDIISGAAKGLEEIPAKRAKDRRFPVSWLFRANTIPARILGFGFGLIVIGFAVFAGVIIALQQSTNWLIERIRNPK